MFKTYRTYDLSTGVKSARLAVLNQNNTDVSVLLHKTIVVSKKRRFVRLSTGGWDTVSTRIVINRALEQIATSKAFLFRKKGITYLSQNGVTQPFHDGTCIKVRNESLAP